MTYPMDDFILKGSEVLSATACKKLNPTPTSSVIREVRLPSVREGVFPS